MREEVEAFIQPRKQAIVSIYIIPIFAYTLKLSCDKKIPAMNISRPFFLITITLFLSAVSSCKKSDTTSEGNTNTSQGNRLTLMTMVSGNTTYILENFYYSGNSMDSVTYQDNIDHTYYVWRNTYAGGLLQEVSVYQLVNQVFKPLSHSTVQQYVNGIPATIKFENYNQQDTVVVRIIYAYTYNSQGLISGFSKSYLNGSTQTLFAQADFTYDGNLRKQVYIHNISKANNGDLSDDYTWSGNQLLQNVKTSYHSSIWSNYQKYTYEYANNQVSAYTFYQVSDQTWQQMYTTTNTYNADGNISEQINTPYSSGAVAHNIYTYTQGSPLYRSFILVSKPEWPLDSPVIPTPP